VDLGGSTGGSRDVQLDQLDQLARLTRLVVRPHSQAM
jgi:hypothetical protein